MRIHGTGHDPSYAEIDSSLKSRFISSNEIIDTVDFMRSQTGARDTRSVISYRLHAMCELTPVISWMNVIEMQFMAFSMISHLQFPDDTERRRDHARSPHRDCCGSLLHRCKEERVGASEHRSRTRSTAPRRPPGRRACKLAIVHRCRVQHLAVLSMRNKTGTNTNRQRRRAQNLSHGTDPRCEQRQPNGDYPVASSRKPGIRSFRRGTDVTLT